MFTISPSLYSADLLDLREVIGKLKGFEHLHLEIDDGNFVRGISFGMEVVKGVAECTEIPLDAHLEVLNPMEYVEPLCEAGVEMICAHVESLDFPSLFLGSVHQYGKKAGLALNVKTPIEFIEPYVDRIEQLILVSCEADAEGLKFQTGVLKKISKARKIYIFAVRSSEALANFLGYYYSMIFGNVTVINTYSETEISEKLMRMCKDDVMIGISFPRYSKAAVFAVQTARKRGAKAIALTDSLISPLADSADYLLLARSGMASVVDSLVAPLGMINALIVATVLNRREEAEKTFNTLEEIWSQYKVYKKSGEDDALDKK